MGLAENIDALLVKYDLTGDGLARLIGVTPATVSTWRHGGKIRDANIKALMEHFNLSHDDIVGERSGLAAKEHGTYMPPGSIPVVGVPTAEIPVLGRVHAGIPTDPEEVDYKARIPIDVVERHPKSYGLIVEGDCMDKVYPDGCLIVIDTDRPPKNGSIGAFMLDGYESVLRRVHRGANTLILSPESHNPSHKDIVISESDERVVEPIGTVVWFQASKELD